VPHLVNVAGRYRMHLIRGRQSEAQSKELKEKVDKTPHCAAFSFSYSNATTRVITSGRSVEKASSRISL
jgi:hypothetical protein